MKKDNSDTFCRFLILSIISIRLAWLIYGEPQSKQLDQFEIDTLYEVKTYLYYWKTDISKGKLTFFHIIDQLMFEMAVHGYLRKTHALLYQHFMEDLLSVSYYIPRLI